MYLIIHTLAVFNKRIMEKHIYSIFSEIEVPTKLTFENTIIAMNCVVHNICKIKIYVNNTTKGRRGQMHTVNTMNKNKQNKEV